MSIQHEDGHFQNVLSVKMNAVRTCSVALQIAIGLEAHPSKTVHREKDS
jgi:hypothetical protein